MFNGQIRQDRGNDKNIFHKYDKDNVFWDSSNNGYFIRDAYDANDGRGYEHEYRQLVAEQDSKRLQYAVAHGTYVQEIRSHDGNQNTPRAQSPRPFPQRREGGGGECKRGGQGNDGINTGKARVPGNLISDNLGKIIKQDRTDEPDEKIAV